MAEYKGNINSSDGSNLSGFAGINIAETSANTIGTAGQTSFVGDGSSITNIPSSGSSRLQTFTTDVVITTSTVLTSVMSVVVPANSLGTQNAIKFKIFISDVDWASDTLGIILKYGATSMTSFAISNGSFISQVGWIEGVLYAAGATNSQDVSMQAQVSTRGITPPNLDFSFGVGGASEDSTTDLTLDITAQWSIGNGAVTFSNGYIELIS